jgi:hypothetical protein
MIRLKGEDAQEALILWAKKEISESTARLSELGRFLFAVSAGSLAVIVSLKRLSQTNIDAAFFLSFVAFFVSIAVALYLAVPKRLHISDGDDLLNQHDEKVRISLSGVWFWLIAWFLAIILGFYSVF